METERFCTKCGKELDSVTMFCLDPECLNANIFVQENKLHIENVSDKEYEILMKQLFDEL